MPRSAFYYDGHCRFCVGSVNILRRLDWFRLVQWMDFQTIAELPPGVSQRQLLEQAAFCDGESPPQWGFRAFRALTLRLPLLWPLAPLAWLPGAAKIGQPAYLWVARHRYLLSRCRT